MSRTRTAVVLAAAVVFASLGGIALLPAPVAAASSASISASPTDTGATATHRVTATVGSCVAGDSLNKLRVDYSVGAAPADVGNVSTADVQTVGIDTDGDGTIDTNVSSDLSSVSASNDGHTLNVGFGGSYSLYDGDTVVIEFADVGNPDTAGTYDVNVSLNYQSDPVCPATASLRIEDTDSTSDSADSTNSTGDTSNTTDSTDASVTATVAADPTTAGATATHRATIEVGENTSGDSLNKLRIDYSVGTAPADVNNVSLDDVRAVGIDTDDDGTIDTAVSSDLSSVSVSNDGHTLNVGFGGSYSLGENDTVVIEYAAVRNPATAGTYDVAVTLNYQSDPVTRATATLSITEGGASDQPSESVRLGLDSASIEAVPSTAAVGDAVHTVRATVTTGGPDASLQGITVDYTLGADPADVGDFSRDHLEVVGVDTDGDGSVDRSISASVTDVSTDNAGEAVTVSFDGSATIEDGEVLVLRYADVQNPAGGGSYDVGVTVRAADQRARAVASLTVDSTTEETDGSAGETAVAVSVDSTGAGATATAVIQNARAGDPVIVDTGFTPDRRGATLTELTITFAERTDAILEIESEPARGVDVPGPDLDHLAIRHGDLAVTRAVARFVVGNATLSARGVAPEDVVLVRRHEGRWQVLDTRVVGPTDRGYRFAATAPGLSTFAVSARPLTESEEPVFRVTDTSLSIDPLDAGKRVQVSATVRNVGTANGTFTANLTANGVVLTNESLSLPAGESGRLTFAHTFSEPAVYDLAVGGVDAGAVEVDRSRSRTRDPPPIPPTQPVIPPVLLGLLIVVSLTAVAVWLTRSS